MTKTLITFTLAISLGGAGLSLAKAGRKVYICNTKNAVAFHLKRDCQGLQKCKGTISEVTEAEAETKGLHLCEYED
jgi:hypothetical protein